MTSPSPDLLPHAMDVFDRLDRREADAATLRQQLTQMVVDTAHHEGLGLPLAAIEQAVNEHLAEGNMPVVATENGEAFPWPRPQNEDERLRRIHRLDGLHHQFFRWVSDRAPALVLLPGFVAGIGTGWGLAHLGVWGVVSGVIGVVSGLAAVVGSLMGVMASETFRDRLDLIVPTDEQAQKWLSAPKARSYVRQCFTSGFPVILEGDVAHLRTLMREHGQSVEARLRHDAQEAQRKRDAARLDGMRRQFLAPDPKDSP